MSVNDDLATQIAQMRQKAKEAESQANKHQAQIDQAHEELGALLATLKTYGCQTWEEAEALLAKLTEETQAAADEAHKVLVAEGILI